MRVGISEGYLSRVLSGKHEPGIGVFASISKCFSVSIDWIVTGQLIQHLPRFAMLADGTLIVNHQMLIINPREIPDLMNAIRGGINA